MTKNYCIEIVKMQLHSISIHFDISNDIVSNIIIIDWFQRCENNCTKMKLFVITHNKKKKRFFVSRCNSIDNFFFRWHISNVDWLTRFFFREKWFFCASNLLCYVNRQSYRHYHEFTMSKNIRNHFIWNFIFFYANHYQLQQNECSHLYDELKFFNTNEFKIVFQKKFNNKYSKISWNFSLLFKSILHKY